MKIKKKIVYYKSLKTLLSTNYNLLDILSITSLTLLLSKLFNSCDIKTTTNNV